MNRIAAVLLAVVLATACGTAPAAALAGRVVAVHDGDTLTVLVDRRGVRVRLAGIDAPERGQPYANASRRALAQRVAGREVAVDVRGFDGYGRVLGIVRVGDVETNRAQVRDGWAWVFRRYENDPAWLVLEGEARQARRGLWRDAHPEAPWVFRERRSRGATIVPMPRAQAEAWDRYRMRRAST